VAENFDPSIFIVILPEILLVVLIGLVLLFDILWREERRRNLGWLTLSGLGIVFLSTLILGRPGDEAQLVWGGMLRHDWLGFVFKLLFLFSAGITVLFAMEIPHLGRRGEFYLLLLVTTIGMNLMASSANLIMLYLSIETASVPLYILAGFYKTDDKSTESGFKYLLFGAMSSAVMLYGFSLLFGFSGTTDIYILAQSFMAGELPLALILGPLVLIMVGFGFKVSIVPFHFWAPDVYEGAPTPVAGFLSTASKAAGFAVLMRFLLAAFPETVPYWSVILAVLATASMTLGNVLALAQKNIKRLIAYSSIAHAGYALIGVAAATTLGLSAAVFYLIVYVITNLAAFGLVSAFSRVVGSDDINAYSGMSRRAPGFAWAMMVTFLSLAGMPPLGGFIAKVLVFAAAVEAGLVWLAVVGVLNSIIGLYYYLIILKVVFLYRSEDEDKPFPVTRTYNLAFTVLVIGIILLGTIFAPWFAWSGTAALALF
jgi:NADH-quinone oxidoreductase subunit N